MGTAFHGAAVITLDAKGRITAERVVGEQFLPADDRFMWTMDTFLNQQTGYFFEMNPSLSWSAVRTLIVESAVTSCSTSCSATAPIPIIE